MTSQDRPIDLISVIDLITKNWILVLGLPAVIAVLVYFLVPTSTASFSATATLTTNGDAPSSLLDRVILKAHADEHEVTVQQDGARITLATLAPSETEARGTLEPLITELASAKLLDDEGRLSREAAQARNAEQLVLVKESLDSLIASPPASSNEFYNPSDYADSLLALTTKINELSEKQFNIERELNAPLAMSGNIIYQINEVRSRSRYVMVGVAFLASAFAILLWLLALEALRRRKVAELA